MKQFFFIQFIKYKNDAQLLQRIFIWIVIQRLGIMKQEEYKL
jgi:hypothetical protein